MTGHDRFWRWLVAIVLVGFGLRVLFVEVFSTYLHFGLDAIWYQLTSGLIVDGKGFSDPDQFFRHGQVVATAFRVPLYPAFLAGVTNVFDGSRHTFAIVGCVVGSTTILMTGMLGRHLAGAGEGLVAAGLVALSPALINVDASVMSETLQVPLITLGFLFVYRAIDHPTVARWALTGAVFGLAMLNRSDALVIVLAVALAIGTGFGMRAGVAQSWRAAGVLILAAGLVVAPWIARNQREMGSAALSTIDSAEAVAGANCHTSYSWPRIGLWDARCTTLHDPPRREIDRRDELLARGWDYATDHWVEVPLVAGVRSLRVWGVWEPLTQSRDESDDSRNTRWQIITWLVFLPTLGCAIGGFVIARRRGLAVGPIVALLAAITLIAAVTYGKQRLRVVAEPEIAILAAIGLVQFRASRRFGRAVSRTSAGRGIAERRSSGPSRG